MKLSLAFRLGPLGMVTYLDSGAHGARRFFLTIALPFHDCIFLLFFFTIAATHRG